MAVSSQDALLFSNKKRCSDFILLKSVLEKNSLRYILHKETHTAVIIFNEFGWLHWLDDYFAALDVLNTGFHLAETPKNNCIIFHRLKFTKSLSSLTLHRFCFVFCLFKIQYMTPLVISSDFSHKIWYFGWGNNRLITLNDNNVFFRKPSTSFNGILLYIYIHMTHNKFTQAYCNK